jgi:DNA primase
MPSFITNKMLTEIRNNADWKKLFEALGLKPDPKKSRPEDWWCCSPLSSEAVPSFHINARGWHCFSTNQGGGVVELVQAVMKAKGQRLNCYEAGRWLLDQGVSFLGDHGTAKRAVKEKRTAQDSLFGAVEEKRNQVTRYNLVPYLTQQGDHPEFLRRGISKATCDYLGCGYLGTGRGAMEGRIVFQVRGVEQAENGAFEPVVLSHVGRATTEEQAEQDGKWYHYPGFIKTLELYNVDKVLLDDRAKDQARQSGQVLILEGCFDVAKLVEAGIRNAVATFGAHLDDNQLPRLRLISEALGVDRFLVWYDRDKAGIEGQAAALRTLQTAGFEGLGFDWGVRLSSVQGLTAAKDACDFSVDQLRLLGGSSTGVSSRDRLGIPFPFPSQLGF